MALLPNLVSYYKMEETSGTRADVLNANPLTDLNTVTQVAGKIGNAGFYTQANSEELACASNATLTTGGSDFSLSCWIMLTDIASDHVIASKMSNVAAGEWDLRSVITSGLIAFRVALAGTPQAQAGNVNLAADAAFHLVVAKFVNSTKATSLSVDNSAFHTVIAANAPVDTAETFQFGSRGSTPGFAFMGGGIDEAGWWKGRALSQADVTQLWNGGVGITYPFGESIGAVKSGFRNAIRIGL